MNPNEVQMLQARAIQREAHSTEMRIRLAEARVASEEFRVTRGPVEVCVAGNGHIHSLRIDGVDSEVTDCVVAAVRAAFADMSEAFKRELQKGHFSG